MKRFIGALFVLFLLLCSYTTQGAEYVVQKGDVFGHIARELGYEDNMRELAIFNGVDVASYAIREGQVIRYISDADRESAYAWTQEQAHFFSEDSPEFVDYKKIANDIRNNSFEYDDMREKSDRTYASEILILADAWQAR